MNKKEIYISWTAVFLIILLGFLFWFYLYFKVGDANIIYKNLIEENDYLRMQNIELLDTNERLERKYAGGSHGKDIGIP
jgi:hypothetical protein